MDVLIDWVTQIILFLVLASVVDLLIPATSMKKYIKLTVGLILILIFLKPVFYLFDMDVKQSLQAAYTEITNEQTENQHLKNSMEMKKSEIQASQRAYIEEQTVVQLKELANEPLKKNYQQQIAAIDLKFSDGVDAADENAKKKLKRITVYLQEPQTEEGGVAVVENVVINTEKSATEEDEFNADGVKDLLHDVWEIEKEKITIARGGGAS
ncbi:stage III sporulation protein AF [Lentibacillus lipolyticus]|nr:stage III sporulation protein AF [Lentibacillus lipolyticus]